MVNCCDKLDSFYTMLGYHGVTIEYDDYEDFEYCPYCGKKLVNNNQTK